MDSSKQYCLRRPKADELYCVGSRKNVNPKKDLRLPFSLVRFFWASKRKEQKELNLLNGYFNSNLINLNLLNVAPC